jgi:probable HAF family extracellular repeat protein
MRLKRSQFAALTALLISCGASQATAYQFSFALPGPQTRTTLPTAINDALQISGSTAIFAGSGTYQASRLSGGVLTNLTPFPFSSGSEALDINQSGQTAGQMQAAGNMWAAVKWDTNGVKTVLPGLGAGSATAYGLNNAGVVVGASTTAAGYRHATIWNGTQATDLSSGMSGGLSEAHAINDAGMVVGVSNYHAVKWVGGTVSEFATLSGYGSSSAFSVNDSGSAVGYATDSLNKTHAMLWNGASATVLGSVNTFARDINDAGQVVGEGLTSGNVPYALLWSGGAEIKLDQYLDPALKAAGWALKRADGINNNGDIVGFAQNARTFESRVFILSAVPEPETYAMLLGGLMITGWAARRRKAG